MTRPRNPIAQLFALTALFLSVISGPATAGQATGPVKVKSLTLGLVSGTSQKEVEAHFQNFVRYIAQKLDSAPDTEGKVVVVSTALQMAKLLEEKKIDFYMESPYPTYLINKQGAAVLLLRRW
jgi:ABC-type phosphate/phosphonate transport system substrate-binding protein